MTEGRRQQCIEALRVGIEKASDVLSDLDYEGRTLWDFDSLQADAEWAANQIMAACEMLREADDEQKAEKPEDES